mgnify:CR=1 FL=1
MDMAHTVELEQLEAYFVKRVLINHKWINELIDNSKENCRLINVIIVTCIFMLFLLIVPETKSF